MESRGFGAEKRNCAAHRCALGQGCLYANYSLSCTNCGAGKFSRFGDEACTNCADGWYSSVSRASECALCTAGHVTSAAVADGDRTTCTPCVAVFVPLAE